MATLKGIQQNQIYPQPGFTPAQNQNGGWEGTHRFILSRESLNNTAVRNRFRKGESVTSLDSNVPSFFGFMTLDRIEGCEFGEGDLVTLVCAFAGAEGATYGSGAGQEPTYELSCGLQDAPFSQHPKWLALTDKQKEALGQMLGGNVTIKEDSGTWTAGYWEGNSFWPITEYADTMEDDALEFAKLIAQGETTYLAPKVTWTERLEGNTSLSNSELNSIGGIDTPRGNPPEANGSRNWMLTSATQTETGSKFSTFVEWTLSEKEGHNSFLYS